MNKLISSIALGAAIVTGSAVVITPAIASAQEVTDDGTPVEVGSQFADIIDDLVADGTLTQAQADAVSDALEANRPPGGRRGPGHHLGGAHLETAAEVLGVDVDTLTDALRAGDTLADIAGANGVDTQVLIDALVSEAETRLDDAVADGRLTDEEAAERRADIEQRVTDMVNGDLDVSRPGGHGPRPGDPTAEPAADGNSV